MGAGLQQEAGSTAWCQLSPRRARCHLPLSGWLLLRRCWFMCQAAGPKLIQPWAARQALHPTPLPRLPSAGTLLPTAVRMMKRNPEVAMAAAVPMLAGVRCDLDLGEIPAVQCEAPLAWLLRSLYRSLYAVNAGLALPSA